MWYLDGPGEYRFLGPERRLPSRNISKAKYRMASPKCTIVLKLVMNPLAASPRQPLLPAKHNQSGVYARVEVPWCIVSEGLSVKQRIGSVLADKIQVGANTFPESRDPICRSETKTPALSRQRDRPACTQFRAQSCVVRARFVYSREGYEGGERGFNQPIEWLPDGGESELVDFDCGEAGIAGEWVRTHLSDAISGIVGSVATTTAA